MKCIRRIAIRIFRYLGILEFQYISEYIFDIRSLFSPYRFHSKRKQKKKIQSLNRNIFSPIIDTKLRMPRQISESNFWRETNTKDVQLTNSLYLVSLQLLPRALKVPWNLPYLPTTHRFQLKETGNSETSNKERHIYRRHIIIHPITAGVFPRHSSKKQSSFT